MESCLSFPSTPYQNSDDSLFLDQPNTLASYIQPAAYSSPASFQPGLSLVTSLDRDYYATGSTPCVSPDKQPCSLSVDPASSLSVLPPLSTPFTAEHNMLTAASATTSVVDPNAIVLPPITQWYHSSFQSDSGASHDPPAVLDQTSTGSHDPPAVPALLPAISVMPDQISVGNASDHSAESGLQRSRRKRTQGDASSTQVARREAALTEKRRRTKACCIYYYQDLDPVPQAVRKLTEANWQYTSIIMRMTSFSDIECRGVWVVYVVKESIPVSRWALFRDITGGSDLRLNPAADAKSKKITSFEGVVVNFPYTSLDILAKNELANHKLPQVSLLLHVNLCVIVKMLILVFACSPIPSCLEVSASVKGSMMRLVQHPETAVNPQTLVVLVVVSSSPIIIAMCSLRRLSSVKLSCIVADRSLVMIPERLWIV